MSNPLTVIQICGAGHSGSTLLGLVLGSHSQAFYLGEAKKARFVGDPNKPARKRACKFCGDDCPVWGGYRWSDDDNLYEVAARLGSAQTLIDSTKGLSWLEKRGRELDERGHKRVVLFLQRDGRAVINSRYRKYPERSLEQQIAQWAEQIEATREYFAAQTVPKAVVRYEEFATDPARIVQELCTLASLPYEPDMLRYESQEHHVLGGNNGTQYLAKPGSAVEPGERHAGYYKSHDRGIRLDLRWHEEMPADVLAAFEEQAGAINAPMAWENAK